VNFNAIVTGKKLYEIRKNDRNYCEGDTVKLNEWTESTGYSGSYFRAEIGCINNFGMQNGFIVFSLINIRGRLMPNKVLCTNSVQ